MNKLVKHRIGFTMILATLLVIGITGTILARDIKDRHLNEIRVQGETLTRLLSRVPYDQFAPESRYSGILQLLKLYLSTTDLVYAAIDDKQGKTVDSISKPQVRVPRLEQPQSVSLELSENELQIENTNWRVIEYRVPLLKEDELVAYVRLAYFKKDLMQLYEADGSLGKIALAIFTLMLFYYYLLSRELKPLEKANKKLCHLISQQQKNAIPVDASSDVGEFIDNFNQFIELVKKQRGDIQALQIEAETSSKLIQYEKSRVESALQTLPDAIVIMDDSGKTIFANKKLESLLGISPESIFGKSPQDWCDDNNVIALLSQYHGNLSPLHKVKTAKYIPEQFPEKTIAISVYPLSSPKDSELIFGTLVGLRDISEQVLAERSREEFVGHVSHELKSPLNVIKMHAELLLEEDLTQDVTIHSTNVMIDEVERLSLLINDLLKITHFESGAISLNKQRVKLHDFLNDVFLSSMRFASQKNLITEIEVARSISTINIDKDLVRIALNNILNNAVKYSDDEGKITLEADEVDDVIQIQITDTGIGMSIEDKERIFDKFFRSSSEAAQERKGHGLGLALAKEIIQLHGGEITVESHLNEGTRFKIRFKKTTTYLKEAV